MEMVAQHRIPATTWTCKYPSNNAKVMCSLHREGDTAKILGFITQITVGEKQKL